MIRLACMLATCASPVWADTVVAARTIPAQSLIGPQDLILQPTDIPGGTDDPLLLIGMEARTALYVGRPISPADVGFPAIVDRNQIIAIVYDVAGLTISTEGRALGRGGVGEVIRVMNLTSKATVTAQIGKDGAAYVSH